MTSIAPTGPGVLVAVDGGGSKTDVVALRPDGTVHGWVRGGRSNPQMMGLSPAVEVIDALIQEAVAGAPVLRVGLYLSGLDLPVELDRFRAAVAGRPWAHGSFIVENDLFALMRAGTRASDAAVVVCGTGINALAVRADGTVARFAALGAISGDWGGGWAVGSAGLWHAARAVDGRGGPTSLVEAIPAALGRPSLTAVIEGLHLGDLEDIELNRLSRVVLAAAGDGDVVARRIVDALADEVVTMVAAALRRVGLSDAAVPVVLGGGVLASGDERLLTRVHAGLAAQVPRAVPVPAHDEPIVGAASLVLEAAGAGDGALRTAAYAVAAEVTAGVPVA